MLILKASIGMAVVAGTCTAIAFGALWIVELL
jgi:hypothetical protein